MTLHLPRRLFLTALATGFGWPAAAAAAAAADAAAAAAAPGDAALARAIANPARTPAFVARDRYRHPAELLAFFGLNDQLCVLEIQPGGGYWTEILAPYLKAHGSYRVAIPPVPAGAAREAQAVAAYLQKLQADPADYGKVIVSHFTDAAPAAPAGSVDLVLSFRNLHDWMADGTATAKLATIYAALKPGGVFGIEDHRGLTSQKQDPRATSGYVREDYAAALIEQAGFKFSARSNLGNNPRDTKTYPKGVWTLPPTLALGAVDRAKYLAIGESDRWTMRFVKA
jgi:predicted methyltransferase